MPVFFIAVKWKQTGKAVLLSVSDDEDIAWDAHERNETSPIFLEQALGPL
jgi:hypothetical protein